MSLLRAIAIALVSFSARNAIAQQPQRLAIDTSELGARLRDLAADSMEGRYPGTRGETRTTAYLIKALTSFGVRPGGNSGWLQPLTIGTQRPRAGAAPNVRASGRVTRELTHGRDLRLSNNSARGEVAIGGELVFVGYGIHAPIYAWDDFAGVDMRGKVAIAALGEPSIAGDTTRFNGTRASRYARAADKVAEMARRGAVGVLWIRPDNTISRAPPSGPSQLVGHVPTPGVSFTGNIAESTVAQLMPSSAESVAQLIDRASRPGFRAVAFDVRLDVQFATVPASIVTHNVIGTVAGTDRQRAGEHIVVSAHWDAYGIGPPNHGDSIYNGALDDASGMTAALALARVFAANPQPRSITFLFTSAEEMGLLGAQAFVCSGPIPIERIVANLNLDDGIELFGPKRDVAPLGIELSSLGDMVAELARAKGLRVSPDQFPQEGFFLRADNLPFARAGVPALYVALGTDDADKPAGFTTKKTDEYMQRHYHRPSDDYPTVALDLRGTLQFAEFTRDLTIAIARDRNQPQWKAGAEFSRNAGGVPQSCR